ncbi:hypothetical protein JQ604_20555 [Bradyrhizobium jicamae]|uniref:hypothetical protein n=1 Tax=Bradyrhizobium jicamae TaxID=280332 RepID=UPI001BAAF263|nr:hypothetical protein [Bradyrhizobium jicamae]MBR0754583.1 hypothetical protein [Bradyrhizobium jicamae]
MPAIFDILYREYCRARLAEMRKQFLISPEKHKVPEALSEIKDADEEDQVSGGGGAKRELRYQ